ncbi:MAG: Appr-1-p processing protein [Mesorhizobium sp.]|nr:MAG: Appr-1-p processing protein [Mesorhizobium sp.]
MSVTFKTGDMFEERAEAIVNTVNCVGVMGKGVALEFKRRWPDNFRAYKRLCDRHQLRPGKVYVHHEGDMLSGGRRFLINFPTKDHWRAKSKLEYIEDGLVDFVAQIEQLRIKTVVMPPLGCGNGGLDWTVVKALLTDRLSAIRDVDFVIFTPSNAEEDDSEVRAGEAAGSPKMTFERAILIKALNDLSVYFDGTLTRITMQKITYFLQEFGIRFGLNFERNEFGPYSEELRDAFKAMERHGLIEGFTSPDRETTVTESGVQLAESFLQEADWDRALEVIDRVSHLIDGYESPYGLELLSSVHFVSTRSDLRSLDGIADALAQWGERKKLKFDAKSVGGAFERLSDDRLIHA